MRRATACCVRKMKKRLSASTSCLRPSATSIPAIPATSDSSPRSQTTNPKTTNLRCETGKELASFRRSIHWRVLSKPTAMISLKRYFNASGEDTSFAQVETSLRQTVTLLISAMESSAVDGDLAEFVDFREEIKRIRQGSVPALAPESLMDLAEAARRTLTAYNKRIKALLVSQGGEVKHILSMLQATVNNIAGENTRSARRLHEI